MSKAENTKKGAALMVLASVFFCVAGSLVKYGSYIGAYKLAFFRFVIGLGLIATAAVSGRVKLVFNNKRLLFLRGNIWRTFNLVLLVGFGVGYRRLCGGAEPQKT